MNLDHDFFQVNKLSEDQKKTLHQKSKSFFPEFKWRPKKRNKVFTEFKWTAPNIIQRRDADQSQIIGKVADVDHIVKLLGEIYSPHPPPGFRHSWTHH